MWKNWDSIGGISFFPNTDNVYDNQPLEEISKEKYNELLKAFPKIDYDKLSEYEKDDKAVNTHKEIACGGGQCEI